MKDSIPRILVIDDEQSIRYTFQSFLSDEGYDVSVSPDYFDGVKKIEEKDFDLVFADIILGDGKTGMDILRIVKEKNPSCPVVIITGYPNLDTASQAVRLGAFDYIAKPVHIEAILHTARMAIEFKNVMDERENYRSNLEALFDSIKDGIITVDRELNVTSLNRAVRNICRFPCDCEGKPFESLIKECNGKECLRLLEKTIKTKEPVEALHMECSSSYKPHIVNVAVTPLMKNGKEFSGAVMVIKDETRLSALENLLQERESFHNIIGKNVKMQNIYSLIEKLADIQTTVLITGESGTGKELVAEILHNRGIRKNKPLVKVNCSALNDNLLESELFGHVKGSFTGAIKDKTGRFELAEGGTIFLDEIGDISPALQLRLLRVLQEREFERLGDTKTIKVDVRVIAATNQKLEEKVKTGTFRQDLYYRLNVVEINLPPLREKTDDIPILTEHFIKKFNKKFNKNIINISKDVMKLFMTHKWPGNIRELEHVMEHAFIMADGSLITVRDLPGNLRNIPNNFEGDKEFPQLIREALEKTGWNKVKAAKLLGINRKTIYRNMEKYNICKEE